MGERNNSNIGSKCMTHLLPLPDLWQSSLVSGIISDCALSVTSDCLWPYGLLAHQAPLSMGILQARVLEGVASPFSRGSSQPRDLIKPRSPSVQADSLPTEPQEQPENGDRMTIPTQLTHQLKSIHHARSYSETNSDQRPKEEFVGKAAK